MGYRDNRCFLNHAKCLVHPPTMPGPDAPHVGKCRFGEVGAVWVLPRDGQPYCRKHLRQALKVAGYPTSWS